MDRHYNPLEYLPVMCFGAAAYRVSELLERDRRVDLKVDQVASLSNATVN